MLRYLPNTITERSCIKSRPRYTQFDFLGAPSPRQTVLRHRLSSWPLRRLSFPAADVVAVAPALRVIRVRFETHIIAPPRGVDTCAPVRVARAKRRRISGQIDFGCGRRLIGTSRRQHCGKHGWNQSHHRPNLDRFDAGIARGASEARTKKGPQGSLAGGPNGEPAISCGPDRSGGVIALERPAKARMRLSLRSPKINLFQCPC